MQSAAPERAPLGFGRLRVRSPRSLVAAGIAFRFWLAFGPLGHPSSDESVVGLMALELLRHGHLHAFYWGQSYGGSLEAVLVAPWLWLFGTNTFALKVAGVLAGLLASWFTWRIARHLFRPAVAPWVGVISLFWPAALVWYGTKEGGFYPVTAALGLFVVLMALNIDEQPRRALYWAAIGIATGARLVDEPEHRVLRLADGRVARRRADIGAVPATCSWRWPGCWPGARSGSRRTC